MSFLTKADGSNLRRQLKIETNHRSLRLQHTLFQYRENAVIVSYMEPFSSMDLHVAI